MARRNPAQRTAREIYREALEINSVVGDLETETEIETEIEGRKTKARKVQLKALRGERSDLIKEARKLDPDTTVPSKLQPLIPFTKNEILRDLGGTGLEVDSDSVKKLTPSYSFTPITEFAFEAGGVRFRMMRNEDEAEAEAVAKVREDLNSEPEIFNRDFIARHIDQEKLKKYVYDSRMEDDYVDELATRQVDGFWRLCEQYGIDIPEESDENDWERPAPNDTLIEEVKERYASDAAEHPEEFFRDIYGEAEMNERMIEAAGIDIDGAAKEAVQEDGWAHFISMYDGNYQTTPAGFVFWRED